MNDLQKGVIMLIKSAITGEAQPLPEGFSIDEAYGFIVKHKIMMLAYDGAVRCGIPKENPTMQKLFQSYIQGLLYSEKQMKAVSEIYSAFDKNGIDYLPLKGCNMKYLYPKPELRSMGDADILIKKNQYEKIRPTVEKIGFSGGDEVSHHFIWESKDLHMELHTMPMPQNYKAFYDYYQDGWSRAVKAEKNRYRYSDEDNFIFIFIHFAKHYLDGGIGLRHITDLYVYLKKYRDMDFDYILSELKKVGLEKFYANAVSVIKSWFDGKNLTKDVEIVEDYILESGNWGGFEAHALSGNARSSKGGKIGAEKIKFFLRTVFPPINNMAAKYAWVKKVPFLLPVAWIQRGFDVLFFGRDKITRKIKYIETIEDEKVEIYREKFRKSGFEL